MSFETHITVQPQHAEVLRTFCSSHGLKYICCLNSSGEFPCQSMVTQKATGITSEQMILKARALADEISSYGCAVVRTKVEEMLSLSTDPFRSVTNDGYFEAHFKVHIDSKDQVDSLISTTEPAQMYFSRNVSKFPSESQFPTEQLLTIRMRNITCKEFYEQIAHVRSALDSLGLQHAVHLECMIYDDNPALDKGWCE